MNEERTETVVLGNSDVPGTASSATLFVIAGPGVGKRLPLGPSPAIVGRQANCELFIESGSVSRRHARVERTESGFSVHDLGSKNGTFINGNRVSEAELKDGDIIKIGKAVLKFVVGASAEARYLVQLSTISTTDPLTGVANRRWFDEALRMELSKAEENDNALSLIMVDIDHFKAVNDEHGHPAGDGVLQYITGLIRTMVRETDILARVGGEEFAIICSGAPEPGALGLAERIREAVEHSTIDVDGEKLRVTVSLGVATFDADKKLDAKALYKLADECLYVAKRNGRNRVASPN